MMNRLVPPLVYLRNLRLERFRQAVQFVGLPSRDLMRAFAAERASVSSAARASAAVARCSKWARNHRSGCETEATAQRLYTSAPTTRSYGYRSCYRTSLFQPYEKRPFSTAI